MVVTSTNENISLFIPEANQETSLPAALKDFTWLRLFLYEAEMQKLEEEIQFHGDFFVH